MGLRTWISQIRGSLLRPAGITCGRRRIGPGHSSDLSVFPQPLEDRLLLVGGVGGPDPSGGEDSVGLESINFPEVAINAETSAVEGDSVLLEFSVTGGQNAENVSFDLYVNIAGAGDEPAEWDDTNQSYNYGEYAYNFFYYEPGDGQLDVFQSVTLTDDDIDEYDETFEVTVTAVASVDGSSESVAEHVVTIIDNDDAPELTLEANSSGAGDSDDHYLLLEDSFDKDFSLRLSRKSEKEISVNVATVDGTATGGSYWQFSPNSPEVDFENIDRTIVRERGPGQGTLVDVVTLRLNDEFWQEREEEFGISLSATNATVPIPTSGFTIDHNDIPQVIFEDAASNQFETLFDYTHFDFLVDEGQRAGFLVSLSNPSTFPVTVSSQATGFAPPDGQHLLSAQRFAIAGQDFLAEQPDYVFAPGEIAPVLVGVDTINDDNWWFSEGMRVDLHSSDGAENYIKNRSVGGESHTSVSKTGRFLIEDDDQFPQLTISPPAILTEGEEFSVTATLSNGFEDHWFGFDLKLWAEPDPKSYFYYDVFDTDTPWSQWSWNEGKHDGEFSQLYVNESKIAFAPDSLTREVTINLGDSLYTEDNDLWDPERRLRMFVDDLSWMEGTRGYMWLEGWHRKTHHQCY